MGLDAWAEPQGFEMVGSYTMDMGSIHTFIVAWQHRERPTFFTVYYVFSSQAAKTTTRPTYEFVTTFSRDVSLTTGVTSQTPFFPRPPGDYARTFSGTARDDVWACHHASEDYLVRTAGVRIGPLDCRFEDCFHEALRKQVAFVRRIPLWPLRAPFWYFIRRRRFRNMSIEEQRRAGWIRMPHELV
jgi:hypothetical protein